MTAALCQEDGRGIFKFEFVGLFVFGLPALFALSPLRARACEEAPPEGEPWNGGKALVGK